MRGVLAAAVVIAVMALAGCTDEPEPRFEEPSESPSASDPTSSAAADPEPWERKTKAGAVAFARMWLRVFNNAQQTGDTAEVRAISSARCRSCEGYFGQIEKLYADGGRLESDGWKLLRIGSPPGSVANSIEIPMRINRTSQRVILGSGKVKRYPGGGTETFLADIAWQNNMWMMRSLDVLT